MALEPGQIIEGKYRIVRLLGEGGMGAVYEGENTAIQRKVAIKILHAAVADNRDAVSRFEKEAQAAGRIGSDHITEVIDLGTLVGGDRFMVMEYLDGVTLSKRIQDRGRLSPAEAAPMLAQLLEGLGAAHEAGIIHRDLKPDNVFLLRSKAGRKDFVKILDFGISKFNQLSGDSAMSMTRTGAVMGTPYYMSPEQAKGAKEIDARSDLYSIGVILYESITGQVPFNADTFNELIFKIVLEVPPPPEQFVPDLDPAFGAIIRKSMSREPAQRFQNAAEFQNAMMQWMHTGNVPLFEESHTTAAVRPAMASYGSIQQAHTPVPMAHHATPQPWGSTGGGQSATQPPEKKSNTGLIAVIAVAAVVILGGGGFTAVKVLGGSKDDGHTASTPTTTATTPPADSVAAPTPTPPPTPTVTAPPATTPATADPPPSAAPPATTGKVAGHGAGGGPKQPPPPTTAPPPPPATTSTGRKIRTEL